MNKVLCAALVTLFACSGAYAANSNEPSPATPATPATPASPATMDHQPATSATPAQPATPSDHSMGGTKSNAECSKEANAQNLKGNVRAEFMKSCVNS